MASDEISSLDFEIDHLEKQLAESRAENRQLKAENERLRGMERHQAILESAPYKLLLAGMESQAELNDGLKQENRTLRNALGTADHEQVVSGKVAPPQHEPPTVVCLCGSTRFMDAFQKAKFDETLADKIVLTIGCDTKSDGELFKGPEGDAIKARLDILHLRKIDMADEVLILNVGGYIGESTRRELEYAKTHGKTIRFLEAIQGLDQLVVLSPSPG